MSQFSGRIGLALGSGAARGWAHIGVIRALEEAGLAPEIVCGSSIGAVVGAAYAAGRLDAFETWGRQLDWRQVVGYFDVTLRGGLLKARKVFDALAVALPDRPIDSMERIFAAVATDLQTGQEVWLREGSLMDALRASVALPGLVTPTPLNGRWLVDGGLVNPVPVSLCRAMGAETVIAVDLNTTLLGRRLRTSPSAVLPPPAPAPTPEPDEDPSEIVPWNLRNALQELAGDLRQRLGRNELEGNDELPSIYEVITNSLNIMQVRISRTRMAGDPPELLVTPRLSDFALMDFDRAGQAIDEGRRAALQALATARAGAEGAPGLA